MHRIARPALLALLFAAAACVPRYRVELHADPFAEQTARRMEGNLLRGGRDWVALNVEEVRERGADSARYRLAVEHRAHDAPLRIRAGESLLLLVDGERVALTGAGSGGRRERGVRGVTETAYYPVSGELLRRMAAADSVRVRVVGSRYYLDRAFGPRNFARLRAFLQPAGAPATAAPADTAALPAAAGAQPAGSPPPPPSP